MTFVSAFIFLCISLFLFVRLLLQNSFKPYISVLRKSIRNKAKKRKRNKANGIMVWKGLVLP